MTVDKITADKSINKIVKLEFCLLIIKECCSLIDLNSGLTTRSCSAIIDSK